MEMGEWGITELIYNMKKCKSCNKIKELSDFNKNKIKPDGLQGQCRECSNNNCKYHYNNNKKIILPEIVILDGRREYY